MELERQNTPWRQSVRRWVAFVPLVRRSFQGIRAKHSRAWQSNVGKQASKQMRAVNEKFVVRAKLRPPMLTGPTKLSALLSLTLGRFGAKPSEAVSDRSAFFAPLLSKSLRSQYIMAPRDKLASSSGSSLIGISVTELAIPPHKSCLRGHT